MTDEKAELLKRIEALTRKLSDYELDLAIGFVSKLETPKIQEGSEAHL